VSELQERVGVFGRSQCWRKRRDIEVKLDKPVALEAGRLAGMRQRLGRAVAHVS
jgi:hypothetical protein